MKYCCCFCGKQIEKALILSIVVRTVNKENKNSATQELFAHKECFTSRLYNSKHLYLEYIMD